MHGRPRKSAKPEDAASIAKASAKAANIRTLQTLLLHNHHEKIYDKEALDISSRLIEINPEVYTAWNYRKLAVESNLQSITDADSVKDLLDEELRVVESALRQNFKSYGAWHHRKWVLSKGFSSIDREFRLLDQFQNADPRNFHAWNYRRFVAALKNVSEEEELKFTTDMICGTEKMRGSLSNYSAWHNRSVLLSHLLRQNAQGFVPREKVLTEEYDLIHNAIFTDPDDQSAWFYHLWLLIQTVNQDAPLLISSWPVHGSDLILSSAGNMDGCVPSPFTNFNSEYFLHLGLPLILYFNQAVDGVNSSTVIVKSKFDKNEHLTWRPLPKNKSGKALAWVTYLKVPDVKCHDFKPYPVEVSIGHTQGIISSSGSYSSPSQFGFMINPQYIDLDNTERESGMEKVVWNDNNFYTTDNILHDLSPPVGSFDQLSIAKDQQQTVSKWHLETLADEIDIFRQLLSDIDCKLGKLTLARLLIAHDAMISYGTLSTHKSIHSDEVLELFDDLMTMDPGHSRYYKDEHSSVLMEQVTSDRQTLVKHCWYYRELSSSSFHQNVCLRLNNLSLSRIGFVERLLWVQMLDLSQNELRSIEGLEAMQLLTSLNLSDNRISNFTALEPLRMIKTLRVLNISYNEIGVHSIDTTRYLCSSPLSHTVETNLNFKEYATDNIKVTNCWEAILILKDLCLTQLDIVGNAVNDENFRMLLVKVLPSLNWLDDVRVQ
ncbi:RAB geranylgeranyl transferase alpha subunit 1 [Tasmannia lanceolata]|uniref:RAB geranylgeranyl transferase alpha subunit 1 n=1 Tax=Tasmannia lanceolata TaxID=3420 RepID=UPI00406448F7